MKNINKNIRRWIIFFMIALVLSGFTAIPVETELNFLSGFFSLDGNIGQWIDKVCLAFHDTRFIITLLAIIFMVPVCLATIRNGHSVTDDLYEMFVYTSCTSFWWKWIAEKTS